MSEVPADLRYSGDHLWARPDPQGDGVRVGISDYAQQALGDIIAITLPNQADAVAAQDPCGDIESTKNLSDLISPVTGTVRLVNSKLEASPELINSDPYGEGWLFELTVDKSSMPAQLDALMDVSAYRHLVGD